MKILVTGGAGYIGSVLTHLLLEQGHEVRVLDRLDFGGSSLLGVWTHPRFEFVKADVRDLEAVEGAVRGLDAVVHLAAIVGDPACARQPELAREVNHDAAIQLYDVCQRQGVKSFVFASTCSNYGRMADPSEHATEESALNPVSLYAETKVAVEEALMSAPLNGGPAPTVLRFATVFGLSPRMRFDLTVNEFTLEMLTRGAITVYGEQFWRPYIHVRDAARAVTLALDTAHVATGNGATLQNQEADGCRVFNVGDTGQNYQKKQLVKLIQDEIGREVAIEYVRKDEDPRDYRVSFEKIRSALRFEITRTVSDGIREIKDAINCGVITDYGAPRYRN